MRMSEDQFEELCKNHDWTAMCAEARRSRAAEEHLRKAVSAQFHAAIEEAERASAIIVQKDAEVKAVLAERDAAVARLEDLGQMVDVKRSTT